MSPSGLVSSQRLLGVLACSVALALTGCGLGVSAPSSPNNPFAAEAIPVYGSVYGGQTPITHAVVNLYSSGTTGYGSGASKLATFNNPSDTNGSFSFTKLSTAQAPSSGISDGTTGTWACPLTGDPIIYILAVGGDPQSGTNPAVGNPVVVQAAAIGPCSSISSSTHLQMNEISTVAFTSAFGQYLSPGTGIGNEQLGTSSSTQGQLGLLNAWNTLSSNLILVATGSPYTAVTYQGTNPSVSGVTVTATPESTKIIAMANILASCVNNSNTSTTPTDINCKTLFDSATPPILASATAVGGTFPVADDTLMASLYMAINPANLTSSGVSSPSAPALAGICHSNDGTATTNVQCLYDLIGTRQAFAPGDGFATLAGVPSDWTIGITYTSSGNCTGGGAFIDGPYKTAVDASGNVFFVSANGTTATANLSKMSSVGAPLACGGLQSSGRDLTIDPSGNAWATFNTAALTKNSIFELPAGTDNFINWTPLAQAYGIISDGSGNIYYSNTANGGTFYKFAAPGTNTTPFASTLVASPLEASASPNANYMAFNTSNVLSIVAQDTAIYTAFNPAGSGSTGATIGCPTWAYTASSKNFVCTPGSGNPSTVLAVGDEVTFSGFTSSANATAVAVQNQRVAIRAVTSTTYSVTLINSYSTTGANIAKSTNSDPSAIATINSNTFGIGSSASTSGSVYGLSMDNAGYLYTGTTCCNTDPGKFKALVKATPGAGGVATLEWSNQYLGGINGVRSTALDGADNVWVGNEYSSTATSGGSSTFFPIAEIATSTTSGTTTFTALSPNGNQGTPLTGTTCTTGTSGFCPSGGGFLKSDVAETRGIAIDPSGSVWLATTGNEASIAGVKKVVQIVGAAVPVVTPLSVGIANSQLATKP